MKKALSEGVPFLQDQRGKKTADTVGLLNLDHNKSLSKCYRKRQKIEAEKQRKIAEKS